MRASSIFELIMIVLAVLARTIFCISMCEEPKICVELYNQGLNLFLEFHAHFL